MHYLVYYIIAHKSPQQLLKLINQLTTERSLFFIHIDAKVDISSFKELYALPNCHVVKKRVASKWGSYQLMSAMLNGLSEISQFMSKEHGSDTYHCIFLSGEDLPLKSDEEIVSFLARQKQKSFIYHWALPYNRWWGGGMYRFEQLYILDPSKHPKIHAFLNKFINKFNLQSLTAFHRLKKRYPDIKFYGSYQWMILNKNLISKILEASAVNLKFKQIFRRVFIPDELYFIMLIKNFIQGELKNIVNAPTHYLIFEDVKPNAKYLTIEDIEKGFKGSDFLFGRKFSPEINPKTMALIYKHLKN